MILEKRKSAGSANYFLGSATSGANDGIVLGYNSDSVVIHKQGTSSYSKDSAVESYANSQEKARLFTFTHSATEGKKTYINGILAAADSLNTASLSGVTTLAIGKGYTGEIGEIVIFTRAIKGSERKAVEDYLGKKWSRKINRESAASCLNGTVIDTGCDSSLASCSISASGVGATVSPAATPTSLNCNGAHYNTSSQVNYTCIAGTGTITSGSCSCADGYDIATGCNSCAAGYTGSGSGSSLVCSFVASCSISIAGVATPTTVSHGSSRSLICNAAGYSGIAGPTYNCDNGNLNAGGTACACDTGRDIATNCVSCLSGHTEVSGVCTLSCTSSVTPTTYNGKTVSRFLTSGGTFSCPTSRNIEVLVVGGGGAGVVYAASYPIVANEVYNITVGAGGAAPGTGCMGNDGTSSNFGTLTALGGGGGGGGYTYVYPCTGTRAVRNGRNGGSGGGSANNSTIFPSAGNGIQTAQTNETAHYGNSSGVITGPCSGLSSFTRCGGSGGGGSGRAGGSGIVIIAY